MNLSKLEQCFNVAKETNQNFVGVMIQMQGFEKPEIIINPQQNFDAKLAYYKKAYNEDLILKTFSGIRIIGYAFGSSLNDIYNYLENGGNRILEDVTMKENTVSKELINELYEKSEKKVDRYWGKCTVLTIQLPNGFTMAEHSACVDPKNYDEKVGLEICEEKIKNKLWELEGYKLQCQLEKL